MPPEPVSIHGAEAIGHFFATVPAGGRLDRIHLEPTRANGSPALAAYLLAPDGRWRGYGLMVLSVTGEAISSITGFPDPSFLELFGLPPDRQV